MRTFINLVKGCLTLCAVLLSFELVFVKGKINPIQEVIDSRYFNYMPFYICAVKNHVQCYNLCKKQAYCKSVNFGKHDRACHLISESSQNQTALTHDYGMIYFEVVPPDIEPVEAVGIPDNSTVDNTTISSNITDDNVTAANETFTNDTLPNTPEYSCSRDEIAVPSFQFKIRCVSEGECLFTEGYTYHCVYKRCVKFHPVIKTWVNANETCFNESASLLAVHSTESRLDHLDFLASFAKYLNGFASQDNYWIQYSDTYLGLKTNETDIAPYFYQPTGFIGETYAANKRPFICEKSAAQA